MGTIWTTIEKEHIQLNEIQLLPEFQRHGIGSALVRNEVEKAQKRSKPMRLVISGCIGPRGDGYSPADLMSEEEAIGLTRAAKLADMPVVISFTVETDGKSLSGPTLKEAIDKVDKATDNTPVYYMVNYAHPTHFEGTFLAFTVYRQ